MNESMSECGALVSGAGWGKSKNSEKTYMSPNFSTTNRMSTD